MVGTDTKKELVNYLESVHNVLEIYYSENKLKMNDQKTKLLITIHAKTIGPREQVKFRTGTNNWIKEDNSIKILGIYKNNRDNYDTHLNVISSRVNNALYKVRPLLKNMNLKNRRQIIYSKIASTALYGFELIFGQTQWTDSKFMAILMRCNRAIYARDYYKVSNYRICKDISVDPPRDQCAKAALRFIHKVIRSGKPQQLYDKLKFNSRHRDC